mmetsp:Transcript_12231/g.15998  ORF Transcript_12231/g.15998 Transcript_12231/m.15998 type:complete len:81 (+) Transcript_12231:207-449(+)|eukprot:CAMPEP_0198136630 /NCGR_PEP_ID=MMETSP1443-20131203/269_1 /TAXON_ID=186043 /ORGANISM="Entomoneis sp., Strain CCMP2396" /LENGTH=80 /DNA_ID=CAMNT_0043797887 /DNA_START=124 /DNA_END=366 /DNA_ORIENTATION=+
MSTQSQQNQPDKEFRGVSVFSPFVMLIERYARKRRNAVVYKRNIQRDRYTTGPPVEIMNGDGSLTRVIAVDPIPAENTFS